MIAHPAGNLPPVDKTRLTDPLAHPLNGRL